MRRRLLPLLSALLLAWPAHASAQLTPEARASVVSSYVWRGLTVVSKPVVQPEATLSLGPVAFDLWANVEGLRSANGRGCSATWCSPTLRPPTLSANGSATTA